MRRRLVVLLTAVAVAAAFAACGDDDEREGAGTTGTGTAPAEEQAQPTGGAVATVEISETDFALNPESPEIDESGVVEFKLSNDGQAPHNLEVETPQGEFELEEDLKPGQSGTLKAELTEPGEYVIYCPVGNHREMGMEGTVTVAGGGGGSGGGEDDSGETESGDAGGASPGY